MALAPLVGMIGAPLLEGVVGGSVLGLSTGALGAGLSGLTGLVQGKDPISIGLDALGGYGGASGIANLAKSGQSAVAMGAADAAKSAGSSAAQSLIDDAAMAGKGLMEISPTDLATGYQTAAAPAAAGYLAANPSIGLADSLSAGTKDLLSPGGMGRFKAATGSSALSSLGVPAAGALMGAMSPTGSLMGLTPTSNSYTSQESYYNGPFESLESVRQRARGYAEGGDVKNVRSASGPPALRDAVNRINNSPNPVAAALLGDFDTNSLRNSPNPGVDLFKAMATAGLGRIGKRIGKYESANEYGGLFEPLEALRRRVRGYAEGGITDLRMAGGGAFDARTKLPAYDEPMDAYAKGGVLSGPGDGMSDSIPATIANKQPARLADGEFIIPADVVSHLGNGSTKAGAQRLYAMMDKVRKARTGTTQQGKQINPKKYLPA
jgi:hypothetical protein